MYRPSVGNPSSADALMSSRARDNDVTTRLEVRTIARPDAGCRDIALAKL
jgi:hypothetical protein